MVRFLIISASKCVKYLLCARDPGLRGQMEEVRGAACLGGCSYWAGQPTEPSSCTWSLTAEEGKCFSQLRLFLNSPVFAAE